MHPSIKIRPSPTRAHPPKMDPKPCSDGEKTSFLEDLEDFPAFLEDFF
jgi:hypothetical protein